MRVTPRRLMAMLAIWLTGVVCLAEPAVTGRVLILDNDRVLEGEIERVGDQYRIRRPSGETWLPASKAQALCYSLEEGYICLRERANLDDPDERLRLRAGAAPTACKTRRCTRRPRP